MQKAWAKFALTNEGYSELLLKKADQAKSGIKMLSMLCFLNIQPNPMNCLIEETIKTLIKANHETACWKNIFLFENNCYTTLKHDVIKTLV